MNDDIKIAPKYVAVVEDYLTNGFRRIEAVIAAGYKSTRARQTAADIFKRPEVKAYLGKRVKDIQMSADEALLRLGGHASGNITEFIGLTIEELKAHPRAALIKRVKFVTIFPEDPAPKDKGFASEEAASPEPSRPYQLVESIELYDAQSAMRDVIKQAQLASGQPTENVSVPQLSRLIELLTKSGKDPASVIGRMVEKLEHESVQR